MLSNLTVNNHNITDRAVWRYQVFIISLSASPVSPRQWRCFLPLLGAFKAVKYLHHWPSCQFGSTTPALCLKVNGALMSTTFMSRWLFGTFRNQQLLPSTVNSNWLCRQVFFFEIGAVSFSVSYFREVLLGMPRWHCCSVYSCMWLHLGPFRYSSFGLPTGAMVQSYLRLHLLITAVNTAIFRHKNFEQWTLLSFSWLYCLLACSVVGFCHSAMGHPLLIILFSNSASQASVIALLTTPSLVKLLLLRFSARVVPL